MRVRPGEDDAVRPGSVTESCINPVHIAANGLRQHASENRQPAARVDVRGKFLYAGDEKFFVRGVTYGTFVSDENGDEYPRRDVVNRDFEAMAVAGINAVRTYTVPPRSLLDSAQQHGLKVMVGLAAERHVGYLNDGRGAGTVERRIRDQVRACAGHPAVLCYALGNEIPASVVRWFGRARLERWLRGLYRIVHSEDAAPVTYVNYPSTEYLQLPFLDLIAFNVYLEEPHALDAYVARLHNLAHDRPLLLTELGLDSIRNGEHRQASTLAWQVRVAFASGCAGAFVYAWTDEWCAGGVEVNDWAFGITDRHRCPKPALGAVSKALSDSPFPRDRIWPRVSVVVCCYNAASTLKECLDGVARLQYPDFEVIVVDDGSADATGAIAQEYTDVRLVQTENRGLSAARNLGAEMASGEIVAYLDADAWPDPHWLHYLVASFETGSHACVGGPNLPPTGDGLVAECIAHGPGGPNHVLLSDREAEHVPGCNMALRRTALHELGGFDPVFRVAGDDVDMCWRVRAQGGTIAFHPAAVVWHHRRTSIAAYWKQQVGYGRAEALLEAKWPEKYNDAGHVSWGGRVYGGARWPIGRGARIYHGVFGTAPFQSLETRAPSVVSMLHLMPEWWYVVAILTMLAVLGFAWTPLFVAFPLLCAALAPVLGGAIVAAWSSSYSERSRMKRAGLKAVTALVHVIHPMARARGRLSLGLTPWRRRRLSAVSASRPSRWTDAVWSERPRPAGVWVGDIEATLKAAGSVVRRGDAYAAWDLDVKHGGFGRLELLVAVEEHGGGNQFVRFRARPRASRMAVMLAVLSGSLAIGAFADHAWIAAGVLGGSAVLLAVRIMGDCALAAGAVRNALRALKASAEGRTC